MLSCYRFVCKNNGVLFENQLLQIGIKSEYRQNLGKLSTDVVLSFHDHRVAPSRLYDKQHDDKWSLLYSCCQHSVVCCQVDCSDIFDTLTMNSECSIKCRC